MGAEAEATITPLPHFRIETYIKTTTEYFERDNKLAKLRTVIWVFIAVLFVVNVVQDGVRSVYGGGSTRPIVLAVYTGVNAIIAIVTSTIYLIYGRKLYVRLLKFKTSGIGADYIRRVRAVARCYAKQTEILYYR